jgi:S-adenosylmethionine synthetase
MSSRGYFFTSESVTEGHPDKVADQISDAILDEVLAEDPNARVACEALVASQLVVIAGEVTSEVRPDYEAIAREVIREIGYTRADEGFDADTAELIVRVGKQSPDIKIGVDTGGAGDQGLMFGYACDETPELMPLPIKLAHDITRRLSRVRRDGVLPYLRPDGKSQVTVEYDEQHRPVRVSTVVVSTMHTADIGNEQLHRDVKEQVILPVLGAEWSDDRTEYHINPTGSFLVGGPHGDTGLTGRKIIVDTYGGAAPHGGGAFSGKDPTKVDRSASYMARYVAKNVVAAGLARKCTVQLAYAIGVAEPVSVFLDTRNTAATDEVALSARLREIFDLTPNGIIDSLGLRRPVYRRSAAYGHFGRTEPDFTWERTDKVNAIRRAAGL